MWIFKEFSCEKYYDIFWSLLCILVTKIVKQDGSIVVSADGGRRYADNPRYVHEYVSKNADHKITWIWSGKKQTSPVTNTKVFVYKYSFEGLMCVAKANVCICSHSPYGNDIGKLLPRSKKLIVIWHGTPVKTMGFTRAGRLRKLLRCKTSPDHVFVQSAIEAKTLSQAWGESLCKFKITMYPRTYELQKHYHEKSFILWAPTFRDGMEQRWLEDYLYPTRGDFEKIDAHLKLKGYTLLIKDHPYSNGTISPLVEGLENIKIIEKSFDIIDLMINCRSVITDYSSLIFDFMAAGGRGFLYTPDYEWYRKSENRGLDPYYDELVDRFGCSRFDRVVYNCLETDGIRKDFISDYMPPNSDSPYEKIVALLGGQ